MEPEETAWRRSMGSSHSPTTLLSKLFYDRPRKTSRCEFCGQYLKNPASFDGNPSNLDTVSSWEMALDVATLTKDMQSQLSNFVPNNEQLRQNLLQSARRLVAELETPTERIARMAYMEPAIFLTTVILMDLKLFRMLSESDGPQSVEQLAEQSGADVQLLERLLKFVAVENFVQETGADEYTANELTRHLGSPGGEGIMRELTLYFKLGDYLPKYFKETKYANPTDKNDSPWHRLFGQHFFDYIFAPGREDMAEAFHNHMKFRTLGSKWYESFDIIEGILGNEALPREDVLLVDVGGSTGADILGFHKAHKDMTGRLILQDLPSTIESLDVEGLVKQGVEPTAHDFFTPQPVKGAKAYYLKQVLHDWPAEQCKEILSNLKAAMKPGYSRILLNEIIIADVGAQWFETSLDILMMAVHAAQERREREWKALIEGVEGLSMKKIWDVRGAVEKIIEIEVV